MFNKKTITDIKHIFSLIANKAMISDYDGVNECLILLKNRLEQAIPNIKINSIKTSKPNKPFVVLVIPDKYPIMYNDSVLPSSYNIDIDIASFTGLHGFTSNEYTAWLIHEIMHNILTTTTSTRIKMLLLNDIKQDMIKYYQKELMKPVGTYMWLDIHSRTIKSELKKYRIDWDADKVLEKLDLMDDWNSCMFRYVRTNDGNISNLSMDYISSHDKISLSVMNKLMQEHNEVGRSVVYATEREKYFNTVREYTSKLIGSTLFVDAMESDYKVLWKGDDRNTFIHASVIHSKISDSFIMRECPEFSYGDEEGALTEGIFGSKLNYTKLAKRLDVIRFEMEDVRDIDTKIVLMYKLRDIILELSNHLRQHKDDDMAQEMLDDANAMLLELKKIMPSRNKRSWGVFIANDAVPEGYEG